VTLFQLVVHGKEGKPSNAAIIAYLVFLKPVMSLEEYLFV